MIYPPPHFSTITHSHNSNSTQSALLTIYKRLFTKCLENPSFSEKYSFSPVQLKYCSVIIIDEDHL